MTEQTSLPPVLERFNRLIYQVWRIPYPEAATLPPAVPQSPPVPLALIPLEAEPTVLIETPHPVADPADEVTPALPALSPTWTGRRKHIHWHSAKMSYRFGRVRIKALSP